MTPARKRLIGTAAVAVTWSGTWLYAGTLPGADLTPATVAAGLLLPAGVGGLWLALVGHWSYLVEVRVPWPPRSAEPVPVECRQERAAVR